MGWLMHAIVIDKKIPFKEAQKTAWDIMKSHKKFYREETNTWRFRVNPKQMFKKFRSHPVNNDITIIFGEEI